MWVWSGKTAIIAGTVVFLMMFIPLLIWQFRSFGAGNFRRLLGGAGICLYGTALVTYTWLPLPDDPQAFCYQYAKHGMVTTPFHFVQDIRVAMATNTNLMFTILQVAFNVVLFIPWGMFVRGYLHKGVIAATISGFLASLLVETTQLTGLWFFYPCAYRTADVDDLIANTLGALIGAIIAPLTMFWMPKAVKLQASRLKPRKITAIRELTALVINMAFFVFIYSCGVVGIFAVLNALGRSDIHDKYSTYISAGSTAVAFICVFMLTSIHGGSSGSGSVGENITWLTPAWKNSRGEITDGNIIVRLWRWIPTLVGAVWFWFDPLKALILLGALAILKFACSKIDHGFLHYAFGEKTFDLRSDEINALEKGKLLPLSPRQS